MSWSKAKPNLAFRNNGVPCEVPGTGCQKQSSTDVVSRTRHHVMTTRHG